MHMFPAGSHGQTSRAADQRVLYWQHLTIACRCWGVLGVCCPVNDRRVRPQLVGVCALHVQVVEEYKGHDSIAYGADWYRGTWTGGQATSTQLPGPGSSSSTQQLPADAAAEAVAGLQLGAQGQQRGHEHQHQQQQPGQLRDIVATCSFYDRRLHLWSPGHTCRV